MQTFRYCLQGVMDNKLIWLGMFVGSTVGGYAPMLFGADMLSMWSIVGSFVGGIAGIVAANKLGDW
ncbi:MAG: hypothetical protein M9921_03505 [Fimbriimonadaceae bacterium]|nr:hypothetical protein [Chthonomonadaceae bacterium]MCO5295902.1 hypothetical protein [Fimbriimonadaceae bacterium]